jgi:hypothetical protein
MSEMLFVGFVGGMTALIVTTVTRYLGGRAAWWLLTGLLVWLTYSGLLGYAGVLNNRTMRPPGVVFLVVPVLIFLLAFLAFVLLSSASARVALAIPLWILLGAPELSRRCRAVPASALHRRHGPKDVDLRRR